MHCGTGSATGTPASCAVDECVGDPCGGGQDCEDKNTQAGSTGDFECSCRAPATGLQTGAPASCETDECLSSPCAMTQMCTEGSTAVVGDFTCTCANGVTATGGDATCDMDECVSNPCGDGQTCNDPDTRYTTQRDFICTCANDTTRTATGRHASCDTKGNLGAADSDSESDSSDGLPWWVFLLIGLGAFAVLCRRAWCRTNAEEASQP